MVIENYPQLKSNENFLRLQDELAGTENRIAVERRKYNETLQQYNTQIQLFPNNIVASMSGFTAQRRVFQDRARRADSAESAILNDNDTRHFANYINGEWVKRRRRSRTATPPTPTKWSACS